MEVAKQERICVSKLFEILQKPQVERLLGLVRRVVEAGLSVVITVFPQSEWLIQVSGVFGDECDFEEIMKNFQKISGFLQKIEHRLETNATKERWNHVKTRFLSSVETLEQSFKFYCHALESNNDKHVLNWIEQLLAKKDFLCSSFDRLLKGVTGGQSEFHEDVLGAYYDLVKGDKYKVENFCRHVLQMMLNGFAVSCLTLTLSKDFDWCEEYTLKFKWQGRLIEAVEAMTKCVKRCEDEFKQNIEKDVDVILNGAEDQVEQNLDRLFKKKYFWLETFWILYRCSSNEKTNLKSDKHVVFSCNNYDSVDGEDETSEGPQDETEKISTSLESVDEPDFHLIPRKPDTMVLYAFIRRNTSTTESISLTSVQIAQTIISNSIKKFRNSRRIIENIKSDLVSEQISYWGLAVLNQSNPFKNHFSKVMYFSSFVANNTLVTLTKHRYTVFLLLDNIGDNF